MQASAVSCHSAIGTDNTMAWDDDGNWIPAIREPDRTRSGRLSNRSCDFAVSGCFSERNVQQCLPDGVLKIGTFRCKRHVKLS